MRVTTKYSGAILGYALLIAAYYGAIASTYHFLDFEAQPQLLTIIMAAWFLLVPLLNGYLHFHENTILGKQPNFKDSFIVGFQKLLTWVGALIGVLLLPTIFAGFGAAAVFYAIYIEQQALIWAFTALLFIGMVLLINNRLLSLLIVIFTSNDSNTALTHNKTLVKGAFIRTIFRSTLAFVLLMGLFVSPLLLDLFVPITLKHELLSILGACVFIAFVAPYFWSMMMVDLHDLEQQRKPKGSRTAKAPQTSAPKAKPAEPPLKAGEPDDTESSEEKHELSPRKPKMKDEDWF